MQTHLESIYDRLPKGEIPYARETNVPEKVISLIHGMFRGCLIKAHRLAGGESSRFNGSRITLYDV